MEKKGKMNKRIFILLLVGLILIFPVLSQDVKYCCERTTYGAWCQEAPEEQCDAGYRSTPTSCESTSYCKLGCCYDSSEGICMEKTPQKVCEDSGGHWEESQECNIPQCQLGCCVLGTQASFVTLTRCKKLSSFYNLKTNFRPEINSEIQCISLASQSDEGACIYEVDYIKTCKFTTRQECNSIQEDENGTITSNITFRKDFLCSAEELGTNCGPTKQTTCLEGKDEVYFVDSCGNPANIYDASKQDDPAYWRKKIGKDESCGSGGSINSEACGNCDYFQGSICGEGDAKFGNHICKDLNCKDTSDGPKKHGEAWCSTDENEDSVGSRYFRHLCLNGEEIIEPCSDFRQEVCIEDDINGFSQAGCVVNKWQDCYSQTEKVDCENEDKRDCVWVLEEDEVDYNLDEETGERKVEEMGCFPDNPPGLKFWEDGGAVEICSQANVQCIVTFEEKGIIGKKEGCVENCECLEDSWVDEQLEKCEGLGDCGGKVNWVGREGNKDGYDVKEEKVEKEEEGGGGLLGMHIVLDKMGRSEKNKENIERG